jgi:hypothetical protein
VQGTEKLTAKANDEKHTRKSAKSQKGGMSTKCRKASNVTQNQKRQYSPSPQQRQQSKNKGGPKREGQRYQKARNSSLERVCGSATGNRSENGKSSGARVAEKPL